MNKILDLANGNKIISSTSKTRKIRATRKNRSDKGTRGSLLGINPLSKGLDFSRSDNDFFINLKFSRIRRLANAKAKRKIKINVIKL